MPDGNETYAKLDADVFTRLASNVSLCSTKEDGGKIDWVSSPLHTGFNSMNKINEAVSHVISQNVIESLFKQRVKGGDVLKIEGEKGWHLIRVDDLHIELNPEVLFNSSAGTKNIINKKRRKLKGHGKV